MEFLWPSLLYLLFLIPLLIAAYVWALRRRRKFALRYSSLALFKGTVGRGPGLRRHIPPALYLLAIAAMIVALARPSSVVTLPAQEGMVILAIDVSGSMRAEDIKPNRIEAAKTAAKTFVERQDPTTRVGVVAFSGNAALVQPPTTDHDSAIQAIDRLTLGPRTAIGSAILTSMDSIFEVLYNDPAPGRASSSSPAPTPTPTPVPPGVYIPAIIILLTDGQSNSGPSPLEMARLAADRGIRIYTVGVGTPEGTIARFPGGAGGGFRTALDEKTLKEIARVTDARYYYAKTETDLHSIYENLNTQVIIRTRRTEITFAFTALAAVLLLAGGALSLLWFNRLP